MHLLATFAVFTIAVFSSALASRNPPTNTCNYPPQVESFAASYYTALVLTQNQEIINSLQLDGGEASLRLFIVVKQVLDYIKLCNANSISFAATNDLANVDKLTLLQYLSLTAYSFGQSFYQLGALNCQNSLNFGIQLANYTTAQFQQRHLDPKQFMSYMEAALYGLTEFNMAHGIDLEKVAIAIQNEFVKEVKRLPKKQCGSSTSSSESEGY